MNSHTENNTDNERTDKKHWFALYTLALGLAMIVVDGAIVGVALPDIITKLNLNRRPMGELPLLSSVRSIGTIHRSPSRPHRTPTHVPRWRRSRSGSLWCCAARRFGSTLAFR